MRSGNSSLPVVNRCALHMEIAHPQTARTNGWLSCADEADDIKFIGNKSFACFASKNLSEILFRNREKNSYIQPTQKIAFFNILKFIFNYYYYYLMSFIIIAK